MSGTLTVYAFEGPKENLYTGEYTTMNYKEAEEHAAKYGYRIIAHEYEWADSYEVADYTGEWKDSDTGDTGTLAGFPSDSNE